MIRYPYIVQTFQPSLVSASSTSLDLPFRYEWYVVVEAVLNFYMQACLPITTVRERAPFSRLIACSVGGRGRLHAVSRCVVCVVCVYRQEVGMASLMSCHVCIPNYWNFCVVV